jgi:hypothetical protein
MFMGIRVGSWAGRIVITLVALCLEPAGWANGQTPPPVTPIVQGPMLFTPRSAPIRTMDRSPEPRPRVTSVAVDKVNELTA